jgi:hypothetical protein
MSRDITVTDVARQNTPLSEVQSPENARSSPGRHASQQGVGQWACGRHIGNRSLEAPMGNKDKGGKNTKTAAAKNLKEKRINKKEKRTAAEAKRNRAVK